MIYWARRSPSGLAVFPACRFAPHQDRNAMKAAAKAGLDRYLIYRMHVLSKMPDRGISDAVTGEARNYAAEARVILHWRARSARLRSWISPSKKRWRSIRGFGSAASE